MQWWRDRQERLARRRPRADGLSIERIIESALTLVDRDGIDALTVRRLAEELDTGSASLYRHVASRDELLVLVADHVLGEMRFPPEELTARQKVEGIARELRRVLLVHPHLLPALRVAPMVGPNAMRGAERSIGYLLQTDAGLGNAITACFALIDFVLGTVFFETSTTGRSPHRGRGDGPAGDRTADRGDAEPEVFAFPTAEDIFTFGLTALLDGLWSRRPPSS